MFSRFAAYQGATGLNAALGHALDDLGDLLGNVLAAGNVIQEDQGLGTGADDVVDAHGHTVDADGIVLVHVLGHAQFGADTVGAGDQDRMLHAGAIQFKQAAEAAQTADAVFGHRAGYILLHQFDRAVAGRNIHAGSGVAGRIAFFHVGTPIGCCCKNADAAQGPPSDQSFFFGLEVLSGLS